jgi:hypothetical protein
MRERRRGSGARRLRPLRTSDVLTGEQNSWNSLQQTPWWGQISAFVVVCGMAIYGFYNYSSSRRRRI